MGRSRTGAALGMAKALKGLMVVGYVKPCGTEWLLLIGRKDYLLWWRCWRSSGVSRAQGEARYRACSRGPSLEPCGQQQSAITCRWRPRQNFPRRIALDDRFTATNLNPVLARPGHKLPPDALERESLSRQLRPDTCRTSG